MEDEVFHFNDRPALKIQSDSSCAELYDHYIAVLLEHDVPNLFESYGKDSKSVVESLRGLRDDVDIRWMASYGCAILVKDLDVLSYTITVVGLAEWKDMVHSSINGREATAVPNLIDPAILEIGTIRKDCHANVMKSFEELMQEAQAKSTSQKNHKTPTFVWGLLLDALVQNDALSMATANDMRENYWGGTSDVGRHTSCLERNTSFPLVASVYCAMLYLYELDRDRESFRRTLCVYYLHHLRSICGSCTSFDRRNIDRGVAVIREIERYVFEVKSTEFQEWVVAEMKKQYQAMENLTPVTDEELSTLPQENSIDDLRASVKPPQLPTPTVAAISDVDDGYARSRALAKENLEWSDLTTYKLESASIQDVWVVLGRLNEEFWGFAKDLLDPEKMHDPEDLKVKMNHYIDATSRALQVSKNCVNLMSVELRSCQMLVIWIASSWAHRIATEHFPIFNDYSAALDPENLYHLVLQERDAIDAMKNVQAFLRQHRQSPFFPFLKPRDTLHLALSMATAPNDWGSQVRSIYEDEMAAAEAKISARYEKIKKDQNELRILDPQLKQAERNLKTAQADFERSEERDYEYVGRFRHRRKEYTAAYFRYQKARDDAQNTVSDLQSKIARLDKQPADIFLPLPKDRDKALQWLFFLFMPAELVDVLSLAHLAQTQLWRSTPPTPPSLAQCLSQWFVSYKATQESPVSLDGKMSLGSMSTVLQSPLTRTNIRQYGRETGVFFPDTYSILPSWCTTDPFSPSRSDADTAIHFTETLPGSPSKTMQSFMVMLPNPSRGNIGIATKHSIPDGLSYEEYQMFASLRAFPNTQIRQFLVAMADDLLPFGDERVHVLVRQLLYHVGRDSWKTDLQSGDLVYNQIADLLDHKALLLKESPNNVGQLLLFGIASSFFGQSNKRCLACSREYMAISLRLGDLVDKEERNTEKISPHLFWKQAQLYGCALLSHSPKDHCEKSLLQMVELIVLFQYKALFAAENTCAGHVQEALHFTMARDMRSILVALETNLGHLTKCLGLIIDDLPPDLTWTTVSYPEAPNTACFEALADHHYSINVLNGIVLVDGVPPGFLPSSIVSNPLYQRTFGSRNFECIVLGVGHFRTSRLVDDRFLYEFHFHDDQLDIVEYNLSPERSVGQDAAAPHSSWFLLPTAKQGKGNRAMELDNSSCSSKERLSLIPRDKFDLPILLTEPHSHWYSAQHDAFLFRPISYKERSVFFVATKEALYEVPADDIALPLEIIIGKLNGYDRFLFLQSNAFCGLARIEEHKFILPWVTSNFTSIRYSMPRNGLEFFQKKEVIHSVNFSGFKLKPRQTLEDTLPGVTTYLILVDELGNEKVIVPPGVVSDCGNVRRELQWNHEYSCHTYDVHPRFRHLVAKNTLGRLQLACMYAASACLVAERRSMKTGSEIAIELVRHCWTNQELSRVEKDKLIEVSNLSNLSSTLRLMCTWIWNCSTKLGFLRGDHDTTSAEQTVPPPGLDMNPLAGREYRKSLYSPRLLPVEESTLLGTNQRIESLPKMMPPTGNKIESFVSKQEMHLQDTCLLSRGCERKGAQFPLEVPENASEIEEAMYQELESSWDAHRTVPTFEVQRNPQICRGTLDEVKIERKMIERTILESLTKSRSKAFRVAAMSGRIRVAGPFDLLRLVLDGSAFSKVNPFLTTEERVDLRMQIAEWMMLCVLEDKICRILTSSSMNVVKEELRARRNWNPWEHLHWLVFEVEQSLQIRPYQYTVVKQLLEKPRSTMQLNMGLGKTSVLVPMLILESINSGANVVRINILSSIISVAEQMYKCILTASVQHVRVLTLPFQRNFPLEEIHAQLISEELTTSKTGKCCFLVTPQHRNSLLLKQYDNDVSVDGILESSLDVIDECDAILHQSFQLVYALGDQDVLPGDEARWNMIETLLQIMAESNCSQIAKVRDNPELAHKDGCGPGEFPGLRLLPSFKAHQEAFGKALCSELMKNSPHNLPWMKTLEGARRDLLIDIMSNDQCPAREKIESDSIFRNFKDDILSARGCIAFGVLFHCLLPRHRVDYGIDTTRGKLAVPFSASDTPKARADYSHPDVQMVYTCLSYFHFGLTKEQLKQALSCLQKLGPSAQETIYNSWIVSIRGGPMSSGDLAKFNSIRKIDIDNSEQINLMYLALKKCMKVISFWINKCGGKARYFPKRRVTSAWDLVPKKNKHNAVGFSGTKENSKLMPPSIEQIEQQVTELRATDGAMIDRILKCTTSIHLLKDEGGNLWKTVLRKCCETDVHVLIDVGGLMAGTKNADVAVFLSNTLDQSKFRGVVYFDTTSDAWNVFDFKIKAHRALQTSSLTAAECFVFYDESRCRGSDLMLVDDACALVTIEPGLTKDRFLQGCSRMRKLQPQEQTLQLAGTAEALSRSSTVEEVLQLTIKNSAKAIEKGTMEVYDRGLNHFKFPEPQDIDVSLDSLYGDPLKKFHSMGSFLDATIENDANPSEDISALVEHCRNIGDKAKVKASQLSEECERELEEEKEEEQEEERELEIMSPATEEDWDFASAFSGGPLGTQIIKIRDAVHLDIEWSEKLKCTANFLATVTKTGSRSFYLRPVNAFLYFSDGTIVLVSDYEADKLLPFWWNVTHSSPPVKFGHLSLTCSEILKGGAKIKLPTLVRTSAKLFRGYVNFQEDEREALAKLFVQGHARSSILKLLELRHRKRFLDLSHLDEFSLLTGCGSDDKNDE